GGVFREAERFASPPHPIFSLRSKNDPSPQAGELGRRPVAILPPFALVLAMHEPSHGVVTAGLLVVGDELLSGRTKDKNIGFIAEYLTALGVDLKEVRVVPDEEDEIVTALNALRHRYTYVFTTGGIGPTHD